MLDRNRALREALSRLLAAASTDLEGEAEAAELELAREHAAGVLLRERAYTGRRWLVNGADGAFLDRWRRLKAQRPK